MREGRAVMGALVLLASLIGVLAAGGPVVGLAAAANQPVDLTANDLSGEGTSEDPYEIGNVSELQAINSDLDAHYELVSDVDASETESWNGGEGFDPIGSCTGVDGADPWQRCSGQQFTGTFDGDSHTVSGLTIDRPDTNGVGLFAAADEARFTNLRLSSVNITGGENTGGLAGQIVSDDIDTKDGFVGNVSVNGTVTGELDTAGVVGHGLDITLEDQIVFTGTVVGSDEVGGILGRSSEATAVSTSYVRATVKANGDGQGRVYENEAVAGGLVGNSGNPSDFTNVYTVGSVSGDVAGSIVGGGNDPSSFEDVYWDTDNGPNDPVGGYEPDGVVTPLSTAEMQGVTAEENMDFDWDGTWQSVANDYPVFQWEAAAVGESSIAGIDATDATAVVNETGGVTVVATDEFGNRLESTSISVDATDGLSGINTGDTGTTDSNGQATFTFTEETAGTYDLTFSADESITDTATVTIREGVNCAVVEYSGDGSTDDPYEIDSLAKLQCIKQDLDAHYELVSDVDASATSGWNGGKGFEPIGNFSQPFTGTFDGNANSIEGVTIDRPNDNFVGLFGAAVGTTDSRPLIGNLRLEGVNITGQAGSHRYDGTGGGGVAGLLGGVNAETDTSHARIVNVSVNGTITASGGDYNVAGIVAGAVDFEGRSNGFLLEDQAVFTGEIDAPGVTQVGGMVSRTGYETSLSTGYVVADITAGSEVGGIVGHSSTKPSTFEEMYYAGNISGDSDVGAIVGLVGDDGDDFQSSVYWDSSLESDGFGVRDEDGTVDMTPLSTAEMQGVTAEENMDFDWDGTWQSVANDYPVFQWEAAAVDGKSVANIEAVPVALAPESTDTLTVRATDAFGNPIEGVEITVQDADGLSFDKDTNSTETNGETTFTVETGAEAAYSPTFTAVDRSITDTATMITYAEGNGSESDPYGIGNWYHLDNVRENPAANYTLLDDLDSNTTGYDEVANTSANDGKGFEPIGTSEAPFTGTFDGQDNEIDELVIARPAEDGVGLFGFVGTTAGEEGVIENLHLSNVDVTGNGDYEDGGVGGLVGKMEGGELRDGSVSGTVTGTDQYVGLVVGSGWNSADEGLNQILRFDSHGTVTQSGGTGRVGGLVGGTDGMTISASYSTATVNASGNAIGGLVGNFAVGTISKSYATGEVTGEARVGGLVGTNRGTVSKSYATGGVTGSGNDVGGLVGFKEDGATTEDSYWDTDTTGQASSRGGTGLATDQMRGSAVSNNMTAFDFQNTWGVRSGTAVSYPYLRNNTQSPPPGLESPFAGGTGSESSRFEIENWYHLDNVSRLPGANYTLVADLDSNTTGYDEVANASANDEKGFEPVSVFTGSLDGQGHAIEDLTINRTDEDGVGLFKSVDTGGSGTGTVRNLDLVNVDIAGGNQTGAVAGAHSVTQTIENISVTGHIDGDQRVGGVVGFNVGHVRNVSVDGTVNGSIRVGGLVGDNSADSPSREGGTILNSHAGASVEAYGVVGGLVGANGDKRQLFVQTSIFSGGTITNSSASGTVAVTVSPSVTGERAGGLVGQMYLGNITRSSASGTVDAPDATHVGGLVGYADGTESNNRRVRTIRESYATGDVTGNESVGGLVGTTRNETIVDSYAVGNVTGTKAVGGMIGTHTGTNAGVTGAYAAGVVSGGGAGLIGAADRDAAVADAYWDVESTDRGSGTAGEQDTGTTGLTTGQLKANDSLVGFAFSSTWAVVDNGSYISYPYLATNEQSPAPGLEATVSEAPADPAPPSGSDDDGSVSASTTPVPAGEAARSVEVSNAGAGQQIVIAGGSVTVSSADTTQTPDTTNPVAETENVRLDQVAVEVARDTDLGVDVETYDEELTPSTGEDTSPDPAVESAAGSFQAETGRVAAGYISVEARSGGDSVSEATLDFSVRADYLEDLGVPPADVTMYHEQSDGSWTERETEYLGTEGEYHRYEGTTPSFSVFALGTTAPSVVVTDTSVEPSNVTADETATVRVTLENRGVADARPSLVLTADNDTLQTLTPTVPANASETVTVTLDQPAGIYELAVGDTSVGTLTVESTGREFGASPFVPTPGVAVVLAVLTLLAIGRRRH